MGVNGFERWYDGGSRQQFVMPRPVTTFSFKNVNISAWFFVSRVLATSAALCVHHRKLLIHVVFHVGSNPGEQRVTAFDDEHDALLRRKSCQHSAGGVLFWCRLWNSGTLVDGGVEYCFAH